MSYFILELEQLDFVPSNLFFPILRQKMEYLREEPTDL